MPMIANKHMDEVYSYEDLLEVIKTMTAEERREPVTIGLRTGLVRAIGVHRLKPGEAPDADNTCIIETALI
jgi:hypothetical protein